MEIKKCPICGNELEYYENRDYVECKTCGFNTEKLLKIHEENERKRKMILSLSINTKDEYEAYKQERIKSRELFKKYPSYYGRCIKCGSRNVYPQSNKENLFLCLVCGEEWSSICIKCRSSNTIEKNNYVICEDCGYKYKILPESEEEWRKNYEAFKNTSCYIDFKEKEYVKQ